MITIRVQMILYNLAPKALVNSIEYLDNAVRIARQACLDSSVEIALGDCSPNPYLAESVLDTIRRSSESIAAISYTFFDANLGHAGGQNRLLDDADAELLLFLNPDVLVSPRFFTEMIAALEQPGVGIVEGRQLPIELPKYHDPVDGSTSWASGACLMTRRTLLMQLGGFDCDTFHMHCDDVDLCWRARLLGSRVRYVPRASVFHDKRIDSDARPLVSDAERYYSAEAALLLPCKYSRPDIVAQVTEMFRSSEDGFHRRALAEFEYRLARGRLPDPIDPDHEVGEFPGGFYGRRAF